MTIYQQIIELLKDRKGEIVTSIEVKNELKNKYGTNPSSILLSDFCYNRYNNGIEFNKFLFRYISRSTYEYLGEKDLFTGLIYHKPFKHKDENIVGEWRNGIKELYKKPLNDESTEEISNDQILKLYEDYSDILRLELKILKCKPTELRHLIGRIGEFFCAIKTNGSLAKNTNQQGFDVISNNRRISVKTTAQNEGFVTINQNTFQKFDDLFVVQYSNDDFNLIFYGPKEKILDIKRVYNTNYELDINKLRKKHTED